MELKGALLVVQLLTVMRDTIAALQQAYDSRNVEEVEKLKKEILELQKKVDALV